MCVCVCTVMHCILSIMQPPLFPPSFLVTYICCYCFFLWIKSFNAVINISQQYIVMKKSDRNKYCNCRLYTAFFFCCLALPLILLCCLICSPCLCQAMPCICWFYWISINIFTEFQLICAGQWWLEFDFCFAKAEWQMIITKRENIARE